VLPIRSPDEVLYTDGISVERDAGGWAFAWSETDVNSMIEHRVVCTTDQVIASGPPGRMTADDLDALARSIERDPASLPWCRERRLLERIVADDLEGVRGLLAATASRLLVHHVREPILTIALGVAAWKVAADLVLRGAPLEPPPNTTWDAASYAIAALDDSDGAAVVLQHLLARRAIVPKKASGVLRLARAPGIVHALIDAGANPNGCKPSSPTLEPILDDATPLAAAVVHRDSQGREDRLDVAAALVDRGASLEARDARGRTALIIATLWGYEGPVRWLLDRGANVRCSADARGRTPRSLALERPDDDSSRLVLETLAAR
jgi:hypothetical protein